jgi:hypothetical protein
MIDFTEFEIYQTHGPMTPFDELTIHPLRLVRLLKVLGSCLSVLTTVGALGVFERAARDPVTRDALPFIGVVALSPLVACVVSLWLARRLRRSNWRFTSCFAASLQIFWALGVYLRVCSWG